MSIKKNKNYKNNLRDIRENGFKKVTRDALAEYLGISFYPIMKWERGERIPDIETRIKVADFFNCQVHDIWTETTEEEKRKIESYINFHKTEKNNLTNDNRNGIINTINSNNYINNMLKVYNEKGELEEFDFKNPAIPIKPQFIAMLTGNISFTSLEVIADRIFIVNASTDLLSPIVKAESLVIFDRECDKKFTTQNWIHAIKIPSGRVVLVDASVSVAEHFTIVASYDKRARHNNIVEAPSWEEVEKFYGGKVEVMGRMCGSCSKGGAGADLHELGIL